MMVETDVTTSCLQQHHAGVERTDLPMQAGAPDQKDIDPGALTTQAVQACELFVLRYRRKLGIAGFGVLCLRVCHWSLLSLSLSLPGLRVRSPCRRAPGHAPGGAVGSMILQCSNVRSQGSRVARIGPFENR